MGKSGGLLAYNFREGFRSEYLAEYVFSAFGPSLSISRENDYGLDLICNLAFQERQQMNIEMTYGVQVKSEGTDFKYRGRQAVDWLFSLEFPLLLAVVSKTESKIKIYSTWNLNLFLLSIEKGNENTYPEELFFLPTNDPKLKGPDKKTGLIPLGLPILEFNIMDIGDKEIKEKYQNILKEWLDFEVANYSLRRAGVSRVFGYIKWETNKSLKEGCRTWYRPYFYSPQHNEDSKRIISEAAIVMGLYLKNSYHLTSQQVFKDEFNELRNYISKYCASNMDDWSQDIFKDEI